MNRFSALSNIVVRNDGKEVKFTINASGMRPTEIFVDDTDLEDLTVQLLQLAQLCAQKQGLRPAIHPGQKSYLPLKIDQFATASSPEPGETMLVIPLGLFSLGFSVPSETLPPALRAAS